MRGKWSSGWLRTAPLMALFFALAVAHLVLNDLNGARLTLNDISIMLAMISLAVVSALILHRHPRNLTGWILYAIPTSAATWVVADQYARYTLFTRPGALPFGLLVAWYSAWSWTSYFYLLAFFLPLLFPTGRLLSPRWRPVVWFGALQWLFSVFYLGFWPGPLASFSAFRNPFGLRFLPAGVSMENTLFVAMPLVILLAWVSFIRRFTVSRGIERAQLKWFLLACSLLFLHSTYGVLSDAFPGLLPSLPGESGSVLFGLLVAFFAVAVGVSILRYRLYDIDIIIRRTLVYGLLTLILALLYLGSVILLQEVFQALTGQDSPAAIVLSTLAIAALFNPLRRRLQGSIDRHFYRQRYNAENAVQSFAAALRSEVDLDAVNRQTQRVVQETLQPESTSLWLRKS